MVLTVVQIAPPLQTAIFRAAMGGLGFAAGALMVSVVLIVVAPSRAPTQRWMTFVRNHANTY
jgi:hypothetical protein